MTRVNMQGFTDLKQKVINKQRELPTGSLDWSIYEGQIDLLNEVESLFNTYITTTSINKLDKVEIRQEGELVGSQG